MNMRFGMWNVILYRLGLLQTVADKLVQYEIQMEMQRGLMDKGGNELDVSYRFFY